jgi:hypothetical protein
LDKPAAGATIPRALRGIAVGGMRVARAAPELGPVLIVKFDRGTAQEFARLPKEIVVERQPSGRHARADVAAGRDRYRLPKVLHGSDPSCPLGAIDGSER